jgi:AsmA protein
MLSTGRTLDIGGDVEMTLWPSAGFSAADVKLSNPAGFEGAPFLAAKKIVFAVAVMPLLKGDVEVRRLILEEPAFTLIAKKDGAANWTFPEQPAQPGQPPTKLKSLRLDDMRVIDGQLAFIGDGGGEPLVVTDIDALLDLKSLDLPATLDGSCTYREQTLSLGATIANPRATLEKGATPIRLTLNAPAVKATLDGAVDTGKLETSGASVRALLDWLGSPLPPGPAFAAFDVKSQFAALGPSYAFTSGAFRLDAISATGDVRVNVADNGRLAVSGALAIPALDTNAYLPAPTTGAAGAPGVNTSAAWDAKPMGLRAVDADLALAVGDLRFQKMQFANGQLALKLTNGVADARLSRVSLYGGGGTAHLLVDARSATTRLTSEIDVANVEALPLLTAAIGFDKIEGKGTLKASLTGQGRSQADIMRALAGTASFNFNDGAWRGVNLAQIARTVQATISGASVGTAAKTDFAEFAATFAVAGGVANTTDLRLLNPFVRLDGTGAVDIGGQTLNMRIAPRAVRTIEGQGGRADVQGIGVPFRITGAWTKPSFAPDLGNLVQSQVQRALERNNLGALGGLIGRPKQETTPSQPSPLDRLLPKKK